MDGSLFLFLYMLMVRIFFECQTSVPSLPQMCWRNNFANAFLHLKWAYLEMRAAIVPVNWSLHQLGHKGLKKRKAKVQHSFFNSKTSPLELLWHLNTPTSGWLKASLAGLCLGKKKTGIFSHSSHFPFGSCCYQKNVMNPGFCPRIAVNPFPYGIQISYICIFPSLGFPLPTGIFHLQKISSGGFSTKASCRKQQ